MTSKSVVFDMLLWDQDAKHDRHGDGGQIIVSSIARNYNQFSAPNQSASLVVIHLSLLTSFYSRLLSLLSLLSLFCFTVYPDTEHFTILLRH